MIYGVNSMDNISNKKTGVLLDYAKQIEDNMNTAGTFAQLSVLIEFIKSCSEVLCSQKNKKETIAQEDIDFFKGRIKKLESLANEIASN